MRQPFSGTDFRRVARDPLYRPITKSAAPERAADLHFPLERTTRFELATLTLAKKRS